MNAPVRTRRRSPFIPILLIGVGLGAIADRLGWLALDFDQIVETFWPAALIAVGLNLIFGQRRPWVGGTLALLLVAAIAVASIAGLAPSEPELMPSSASLPRAAITSANLKLDCDGSETAISALETDDPLLFDATLLANRATLNLDDKVDDGVAEISLSARQPRFFGLGRESRHWDLGLTPAVPLALTVNCTGVDLTADLSDLRVKSLDLDLNAGTANLTLPRGGPTSVTIDANAASLDLTIPGGVEAQIKGDFSVTELDLGERFFKGDDGEYHTAGWDPNKDGLSLTIDAAATSLSVH